jgi:hypothetical protein
VNQSCQNGTCVADCSGTFSECSNSCVNKMSDPQHCGTCSNACATNEVCVKGQCFAYAPATGCTTCPCATCASDFDRCCLYPKSATDVVCVSHAAVACP